MQISRFTVNPFGENTYILWNGEGSDAIIVDPGMLQKNERDVVDGFIEKNKLKLQSVLLTHQHIDHVLSAQFMAEKYGVSIAAGAKDAMLGARVAEQAAMFGLNCEAVIPKVSRNLVDGDVIELNGEEIKVIEVPGHSEGGLAFYLPESGSVFVGDSLFERSIGRTDLPGGDHATLLHSISNKLMKLPEDTVVYPGHGATTTIGDEKMFNPYINL